MAWRCYRGGCEWSAPPMRFGVELGWREMLLGVSMDVWPSTIYLAVGIGPLFVWVSVEGEGCRGD